MAVGRHIQPRATAGQFCSFGLTQLDIRNILAQLLLADDRANLGTLFKCMANFHGLCAGDQFFYKRVVNSAMNDQSRRRGAFLPASAERTTQSNRNRKVKIRVVHHRKRIF